MRVKQKMYQSSGGCGALHKNNDNAEEKPTGSRVMRVKVFDEKVSCEAKRWRSKKGAESRHSSFRIPFTLQTGKSLKKTGKSLKKLASH